MMLSVIVVAVAGALACAPANDVNLGPPVAFDTVRIRIETATDTFQLSAEVARTQAQRTHGLMERESIPDDHAMIFLYSGVQSADAGFWMFRTRIPLDIAFLDEVGRILVIRRMEPCPSPNPDVCPRYPPGVPYHAALEVNAGYFERRGIGVGDRVVIPEAARAGSR